MDKINLAEPLYKPEYSINNSTESTTSQNDTSPSFTVFISTDKKSKELLPLQESNQQAQVGSIGAIAFLAKNSKIPVQNSDQYEDNEATISLDSAQSPEKITTSSDPHTSRLILDTEKTIASSETDSQKPILDTKKTIDSSETHTPTLIQKSNQLQSTEAISPDNARFEDRELSTQSLSDPLPLFMKIRILYNRDNQKNSIESSKQSCKERLGANDFYEYLYNSIHKKIESFTCVEQIVEYFLQNIQDTFSQKYPTRKKILETLHLSFYLQYYEEIFIIKYLSVITPNDVQQVQQMRSLQIHTLCWGVATDCLHIWASNFDKMSSNTWLYQMMIKQMKQVSALPPNYPEFSIRNTRSNPEHPILCPTIGRHFLLIETGFEDLYEELEKLATSSPTNNQSIRDNIESIAQGILQLSNYFGQIKTKKLGKNLANSTLHHNDFQSIQEIRGLMQYILHFSKHENISKNI